LPLPQLSRYIAKIFIPAQAIQKNPSAKQIIALPRFNDNRSRITQLMFTSRFFSGRCV
jgi:hypothetical protein